MKSVWLSTLLICVIPEHIRTQNNHNMNFYTSKNVNFLIQASQNKTFTIAFPVLYAHKKSI